MFAIQLARLSDRARQLAVASERSRMARDIHDTLAHGFTGVIVHAQEAAAEAITHAAGGTLRLLICEGLERSLATDCARPDGQCKRSGHERLEREIARAGTRGPDKHANSGNGHPD